MLSNKDHYIDHKFFRRFKNETNYKYQDQIPEFPFNFSCDIFFNRYNKVNTGLLFIMMIMIVIVV